MIPKEKAKQLLEKMRNYQWRQVPFHRSCSEFVNACHCAKNGVKSRIAFVHTCEQLITQQQTTSNNMSNTIAAAPVSKYKGLKFKNENDFNNWLDKTAKKIIWFEDEGQALIAMWVDEHGEILHAKFPGINWNGQFVNLATLQTGELLQMYFEHEGWRSLIKLTVSEVETL